MGLRGTPWDSWLMDILLSLFRFFSFDRRKRMPFECKRNAPPNYPGANPQVPTFLVFLVTPAVLQAETKSEGTGGEELWRVVKSCLCGNLCHVFSPFFFVCLSFPFIFLYERSDVLKATVDRSTVSTLGCSSAILHVHVNCVAPPLSSQEKVASLQKELAITGQAGTQSFYKIAASDFVESVLHFLIIYDIHEILPPSCQEMRRPLPRQRKLCQNMQSPPDMRLSSQLPRSQSCG